MGSLCNFRPMRHPLSLNLRTIHTNHQVLYAFNLPNTHARLTRTRNHTTRLIVAQKDSNNGRNPEKNQPGSSEKSLNIGSNGILPKQETVARRKRGSKYRKPNALREYFTIALQLLEIFVAICRWTFQTFKSSIKMELNRSTLSEIGLGLMCVLGNAIFHAPYYFFWNMFWFVLINGLKIYAVVAIIGYSFVFLW